jgi:hypothetical protein
MLEYSERSFPFHATRPLLLMYFLSVDYKNHRCLDSITGILCGGYMPVFFHYSRRTERPYTIIPYEPINIYRTYAGEVIEKIPFHVTPDENKLLGIPEW